MRLRLVHSHPVVPVRDCHSDIANECRNIREPGVADVLRLVDHLVVRDVYPREMYAIGIPVRAYM